MTRRTLLAAAAQKRRPNIVFIISDDHHWQCLGANGNPAIQTPNLDRLAARGVNFQQGIISVPQCAPSRGVLLSGQEIHQTGLDSNGHTAFTKFTGPTIVEQLKRSGYRTTLVGKWHIKPMPAECGFSEAPLWLRGGGSVYRDPKLRRGLEGTDEATPGHITDLLTDAAIASLKPGGGAPQLLWLAYNAPHTPWYAAEKYKSRYAGRNAELAPATHPKSAKPYDWETYYAVITHLDEAVGRLMEAVDWENTLVVFLGDNGYLCGTKGLSGKVYPWEESVRVPFIVFGGAVRKPGANAAPVASIDLPATFLDYAGVKPAGALSGISLRPALEGKSFPRDTAYACWNDPRPEALAVNHAVEPWRIARQARFKYIVWESGKHALYDVAADPGEDRDLSGDPAHRATLGLLQQRLKARLQATGDRALAWR